MITDIPGGTITLIGVFLAGLGLNLTPCVYPMLTVTVSLFGGSKSAVQNPARAFLKASIYVLGIATMYSVLGVVAAFTGEFFGTLLQSKWVLIGIAFLLFALALSMFGVYTFQLPGWLIQKAGSEQRASLFGIYLSGLFVGVFAAPCIGPPVIALLTFVGTKGDPTFAFWMFFVMSLGLGTPYLILGTFSGLLKKLPRSGAWLVWMEHLFGVVLLALTLFYLMIALAPMLLSWLPVITLLSGGIYLGFLEKSGVASKSFSRFKKTVGVLAIAVAILFPMLQPKEKLVWGEYTPQALELAQKEGKPVILDFYADWCIPCHEIEQFTYSNPEVIHALDGFTRLKVDLTELDAKGPAKLVEQFKVVGVPTILFLDPQGEEVEEARITGFVVPEEFLSIIRSLPFEAPSTETSEMPETLPQT
ncbi:MAG: thioredoxin family protein [Candidatus Omnitrophica bacterium]|nr:thioredoxin family protein [Candidatus Omnitrophota bacterium]